MRRLLQIFLRKQPQLFVSSCLRDAVALHTTFPQSQIHLHHDLVFPAVFFMNLYLFVTVSLPILEPSSVLATALNLEFLFPLQSRLRILLETISLCKQPQLLVFPL